MKLAYPVAEAGCKAKVMAFEEDYKIAFPIIKEAGYDGVELQVRDPGRLDVACLDRCLAESGLEIAAIGTSPMQKLDGLFLLHPDPENRREARERCSGLLELCTHYHAPALIGKYRGAIGDAPGCRWADLSEIMAGICEEAKTRGVRVLLEAQNPSAMNHLNTMGEMMEWIGKLGKDCLGIHADTFHMNLAEASVAESIRHAGGLIGFYHVSDDERRVPGQGTIPFAEVMKAVHDTGYTGYLSPEISQTPDSASAARASAEFLRRFVK